MSLNHHHDHGQLLNTECRPNQVYRLGDVLAELIEHYRLHTNTRGSTAEHAASTPIAANCIDDLGAVLSTP